MTLKELRISKGLSQSECATYLGMSTRNYQNYENLQSKVGTTRYHAIYLKLETYGKTPDNMTQASVECHTNVVLGEILQTLIFPVLKYLKRDCFAQLKQYVYNEGTGKIAILYGLRRTGKTTLLFQMIGELPIEKTAYIKIKTTDNMSMLVKDLYLLSQKGYKYIFIDEVTLMEDFIGTAALLSDIFASMGMKIIVSGADSLGFIMANRDELYDRNVMIHTSFIPFKEYVRLLNIQSIDSYIEYGGTLRIENMSFNDPESSLEEASFRDDESTRKYIDTAISRNIQHTLKNDHFGEYFNQLRNLYDQGELTNVINRIVENFNHQFLLHVVIDHFKSHDFGSAKELLLHEDPAEVAHVLYDVDEKTIIERLKTIMDIKEQCETTIPITIEHVEKVKSYLFMLDLLVKCTERYETKGQSEYIVFCQPGMRYSITKALVYSLLQDEYFENRPEREKNFIIEKILEDVKGRMLEDIVLLETTKAAQKNQEVFKFKFDNGGEYDMVIYDKTSDSCQLYEVKHSDKIDSRQAKYLRDKDKLAIISHRFGTIQGAYVLYRGPTQEQDGMQYLNVEEYLKNL